MLNTIFEKRVIVGYNLPQLVEMLKLKQSNVVFSTRDLASRPEVSRVGQNSTDLAKKFFDADLDPNFKSTIVEARLFLALYRSFEQEIEDTVLKESIIAEQLH
jgi:hypothetical protein